MKKINYQSFRTQNKNFLHEKFQSLESVHLSEQVTGIETVNELNKAIGAIITVNSIQMEGK